MLIKHFPTLTCTIILLKVCYATVKKCTIIYYARYKGKLWRFLRICASKFLFESGKVFKEVNFSRDFQSVKRSQKDSSLKKLTWKCMSLIKTVVKYSLAVIISIHGVPEGDQKQKQIAWLWHFYVLKVHIYPKASNKGRKKIFGVQKFNFLTLQFFH